MIANSPELTIITDQPAETDLRHAGVQVFIKQTLPFRNDQGESQEQLFVVEDSPKEEFSAGLPNRFTYGHGHGQPLHVFAGGRQIDTYTGQPESITRTARREWVEEHTGEWAAMGLLTNAVLDEITNAVNKVPLLTGGEHQQFYPFIVGQRGVRATPEHPRGERVLNEVAATTLYVEFDSLPFELQRELENLIESKKAQWLNFTTLVQAFTLAQVMPEPKVNNRIVRPQLLTAAMIYHWQQQPDWEPDLYRPLVEKWNRRAYGFLNRESKRTGQPIVNGTMTTRGSVRQNLPAGDYEFLNTPHLIRNSKG
jgi:hypothetical protein